MQSPPIGVSDRYRIEGEVGRGGMAIVYRALDTALGRPVAIKVLHPHLASQRESRMRFAREAQAVAKLHHGNIVEIFDYAGEEGDLAYIVTEYIDGETLEALLARRRLRLPETGLLLGAPVCEALAHAHSLGIIHRDIKPGNVMIRDDGTVKLMDFGIAQVLDAQGLTVTGTLLGSPAHMSPEHIEGKPLDFRADVFSLGTLLYLLCVGELPFQGRNPHAVMKAILDGEMRRPQVANPRVSTPLERILLRALERDPARRYEAVDLLLLDLRAYLGDLGVHDVPHELRSFFANPDGYEADLQRRLVEARLRRGREALAARRHAHALEHFNAVLALDPRNWEVLGLLARIGRRRTWERAAIAAAVLGGAAALAWWAWPESPPASAPSTPVPPPVVATARGPSAPERPAPVTPPPPTAAALPAARADAPPPRALADAPASAPRPVPRRLRAPRRLRRLVRSAPVLADAPASPDVEPETRETAASAASAAEPTPEAAPRPIARSVPPAASAAEPTPEAAPGPVARSVPPAASAAEPTPEAAPGPVARPAPPAARAAPPASDLAPPTTPAELREVRINTWPKAVRILVDRRVVGWAGIVDRLHLAPGIHVVRLESPSCHAQEIRVDVPRSGPVPPIVARLAWKPGLLIVDNPQRADVAVDGVYKGTADRTPTEPILVHIDKSNPLGRVKVHVRLSKPGFRQEDQVQEIAAGQVTRLRVVLKPL